MIHIYGLRRFNTVSYTLKAWYISNVNWKEDFEMNQLAVRIQPQNKLNIHHADYTSMTCSVMWLVTDSTRFIFVLILVRIIVINVLREGGGGGAGLQCYSERQLVTCMRRLPATLTLFSVQLEWGLLSLCLVRVVRINAMLAFADLCFFAFLTVCTNIPSM